MYGRIKKVNKNLNNQVVKEVASAAVDANSNPETSFI